MVAPRSDHFFLVGRVRDLHHFGRGLNIELQLRRVVDVPKFQLLVASPTGKLLLIGIQSHRSHRSCMPLEFPNQISGRNIPILDTPIITPSEMLRGIRVNDERVDALFIADVYQLNRMQIPVNHFVCTGKGKILMIVPPANPLNRPAARRDGMLRLPPQRHIPTANGSVETG